MQAQRTCDEWMLSFIDGGRLPSETDVLDARVMTTNNYTERMNRTVESRYSGTRSVADFIERLYGVQISNETLIEELSGKRNFHSGLATYWNSQVIEHKNQP